jgi:hypothetical protein
VDLYLDLPDGADAPAAGPFPVSDISFGVLGAAGAAWVWSDAQYRRFVAYGSNINSVAFDATTPERLTGRLRVTMTHTLDRTPKFVTLDATFTAERAPTGAYPRANP